MSKAGKGRGAKKPAGKGGGPGQTGNDPLASLYGLTSKVETAIVDAITDADATRARALVAPLHPADRADLYERLDRPQRRWLYHMLGAARDPETLTYLDEDILEEVLEVAGAKEVAKVLPEMDSHEAIDILEELEPEDRDNVLAEMPVADRIIAEEGLSYPEDSAGRMMQRDVAVAPVHWTVGRLLDFMRGRDDHPDEFHSIFVTDPGLRVVGQVMLSKILRANRPVRLSKLTDDAPHQIPVDMDKEEVGRLFNKYGLVSAAVVDDQERIVGMITADDVVGVVQEEAEEDMMALGQVSDKNIRSALLETLKGRCSWLAVNLATAVLASVVIGFFDDTIEQLVALAVLMPIVASMGGNAGTQTITVAVRAIAMRQLSPQTVRGFIARELSVGFLNGMIFAATCALISWLWFGNGEIAAVMAAAMLVNLVVAGLFGALIPLSLERLGVDPAVASSVFITTVTDVVGFLSFLGLAAVFLI